MFILVNKGFIVAIEIILKLRMIVELVFTLYKCPKLIGRLAQLVEQLLYTEKAGGSSPSSPTLKILAALLCSF